MVRHEEDSTGVNAAKKSIGERKRSRKPARHNPVGRSALYYIILALIVGVQEQCR